MSHGPMTAEQKKQVSLRMKARWKAVRAATARLNGTLVEQRIVVRLQDQAFDLTVADAFALRDALSAILPAQPPTDPTS